MIGPVLLTGRFQTWLEPTSIMTLAWSESDTTIPYTLSMLPSLVAVIKLNSKVLIQMMLRGSRSALHFYSPFTS